MRHHEETIENSPRSQPLGRTRSGVVVVGSVARGDERPDSDVDVYLVLTDDAYAAAARAGRIAYVSHDRCDLRRWVRRRQALPARAICPGRSTAATTRRARPSSALGDV